MDRAEPPTPTELQRTERYLLYDVIANGGMAAVHIGVLEGALGFSRIVAVKRLHSALCADRRFVSMLIDEARLVSRIRHFNVVPTLDILESGAEIFVIMEYVRGASLAKLVELTAAAGELIPLEIAVPIVVGALRGLGAAHDATELDGSPLGIVHRDVSPHNILVGVGGVPRVIDFGVARAVGRLSNTGEDEFKGKLAYAAPEQVAGGEVSRRSDLFAAGIVLWELVTGQRLFYRPTQIETLRELERGEIRSPLAVHDQDERMRSVRDRATVAALTGPIMRALERDPARRFETAERMARALEEVVDGASAPVIGDWVQRVARAQLDVEAAIVARTDAATSERKLAAPSTTSPTPSQVTVAERGRARAEAARAADAPPAVAAATVSPWSLATVALAAALGAALGGALLAP